jgi:uncharacterized protein YrrD
MLRKLSALEGMPLRATDGDIGSVKDVLFDDQRWTVRYLVVDTNRWLPGRKVLISPFSVDAIDWDEQAVAVRISREQVKGSPDIDTDKPVSRQHEADFLDYYGYPYYWGGVLGWGALAYPSVAPSQQDSIDREQRQRQRQEESDPHLRSVDALATYQIEAQDGGLGHVDDFLYDEQSWALRYLIVDTRNWLPGRRVLVSTEWVKDVSWEQRLVHIDLSRDAIRESPEYSPENLLMPDDEQSLYRHYGRTQNKGPSLSPFR